MVAHSEQRKCRCQLDAPVRAELVLVVRSKVSQLGDEDLALLAEGAGDQRDVGALGDVLRHGDPGGDGLVVRVGVDEQKPVDHWATCPRA